MFNFWPFNIPRKRREATAAEQRLVDEQRKRVEAALFGTRAAPGDRVRTPHMGRDPIPMPPADLAHHAAVYGHSGGDYCAPSPSSYDSGSSSCDSSSSPDSGSCSSSCD